MGFYENMKLYVFIGNHKVINLVSKYFQNNKIIDKTKG